MQDAENFSARPGRWVSLWKSCFEFRIPRFQNPEMIRRL